MNSKTSKTLSLILILSICILAFTSCDPGIACFYKEDFDKLQAVELIYYDNPDSNERDFNWGNCHIYDLVDVDVNKFEIIETLPDEKIESFVDVITEREYFIDYHSVDSPSGYCVRLLFEDGSFILFKTALYSGFSGHYDSNGKATYVYGIPPLTDEEVNSFFNFQIPVSKPKGSIWDSLFE